MHSKTLRESGYWKVWWPKSKQNLGTLVTNSRGEYATKDNHSNQCKTNNQGNHKDDGNVINQK